MFVAPVTVQMKPGIDDSMTSNGKTTEIKVRRGPFGDCLTLFCFPNDDGTDDKKAQRRRNKSPKSSDTRIVREEGQAGVPYGKISYQKFKFLIIYIYF